MPVKPDIKCYPGVPPIIDKRNKPLLLFLKTFEFRLKGPKLSNNGIL